MLLTLDTFLWYRAAVEEELGFDGCGGLHGCGDGNEVRLGKGAREGWGAPGGWLVLTSRPYGNWYLTRYIRLRCHNAPYAP